MKKMKNGLCIRYWKNNNRHKTYYGTYSEKQEKAAELLNKLERNNTKMEKNEENDRTNTKGYAVCIVTERTTIDTKPTNIHRTT